MKRGDYMVVWLDNEGNPLMNTAKPASNLGEAIEIGQQQSATTDAPVVVLTCMWRSGECRWSPEKLRQVGGA